MIGLELAQKLYPHFPLFLLGLSILFGITLCLGVFIVAKRYRKSKNILQADPGERAAQAKEIQKEIRYLVEVRDELDPGLAKEEKQGARKELKEARHELRLVQDKAQKHQLNEKALGEKVRQIDSMKAELADLKTKIKDLELKNSSYKALAEESELRVGEVEKQFEEKLQEVTRLNKELEAFKKPSSATGNLREVENKGKHSTHSKKAKVLIEDYSAIEKQENSSSKRQKELENEDPLLAEFKRLLKSNHE